MVFRLTSALFHHSPLRSLAPLFSPRLVFPTIFEHFRMLDIFLQMSLIRPIPSNELERLLNLSEYNVDFTNIQNNFVELNKLAASIAGTNISLVNLIDCYTQW